MASLAVSTPQRKVTEGWFKVPNSFVENQHLLKAPASRALALIVFRAESEPNGLRTLPDRRWEAWTGFKDRQKEYAIKELREFGLNVTGRGDTAKFSWDWNRWNQAIKTPNPDHKSPNYSPKARTAKPGAKVHEDCHENGCARLRECSLQNSTNQTTPFLVPLNAQYTAQTVEEVTEKKWSKTLAAMRDGFASAGVQLLMKLLAVLWAIAGLDDVSDYVLSEAVKTAYVESRGRWNSPILLVTHVPNVLKGWKAKGQPMDDNGEDDIPRTIMKKPTDAEKPKAKRARDLI